MASLGQRMVGAMQADVKTFQEIEADPTAMGQAVTVIVIAGVASLIGNIFRIGLMGGIMSLIITLICCTRSGRFVIVLIGTKVMPEPTTKADFNEGFRVIGFTASPGVFNVLAIIPFLGPLISFVISIWMLVIARHRGARGPRLQQHGARDHRLPDRLRHLLDRDVPGPDAAVLRRRPRGAIRRCAFPSAPRWRCDASARSIMMSR